MGQGICLYFPRWIQQTFSSKIQPYGAPGIQNADETKTPGGRNSNTGHGSSKDLQKGPPLATSTL